MDKQLQEQAMRLLDAVAAKLGVAAGELWRIEVAHAYWGGLVYGAITLAILGVVAFALPWAFRNLRESYAACGHFHGEVAVAGWLATVVILAGVGFWQVNDLGTNILSVAIPEHYALRSIIGAATALR